MKKIQKADLKKLWFYLMQSKVKIILVLFFSVLAVVGSTAATFMVGLGLESFILGGEGLNDMLIFISILLVSYLTSSICNYFVSFIITIIGCNVGFDIRRDLFNKLQKLPFSWLDTQSTGDIMSRLTNDVEVLTDTLADQTSQLFVGIITVIGMCIGMLILSPMLTAIFLVSFALLYSLVILILKKSQPFFIKKQNYTGSLNGFVEEYVSSQKVVNLFGYQNIANNKFQKINDNLGDATFKSQLISSIIFPYNNFINNFMLMFMTIISITFMVTGNGGYLYGSIVKLKGVGLIFSFILMQRQFTMPISNFMSMINQFQLAFAGANRFFEILNETEEKDLNNNKKIKITKGHVEFKNIDFSYDSKKQIIKNLSLEAQPGTMNAIVGSTGSGKTTLISLLTRFYDINGGSILIDGHDISKYSKSNIRKNITIVLQDTFLFSESIRENILYGNLDATEEDVINAAKHANAWHFIQQLPKGLDTILTSSNSIISEGEKQLIAISRAFLSKAKIIILDEATSYVDTKTERDIQEAMANLMKSRTSFVIAHRLSTIKKANNIVVLKNGELIEQGNHNKLLSKKGLYYNMINSGMPEDQ